jgi:cephalosporin-C deacetylase
MPLIDKPLNELRTYSGINPRPADFDQFWDASLTEMHALDPQVELRTAAFQTSGAECFDLYFTGVNGSRVHAKYLRPRNATKPHPAVLEFHGYAGNSGDWCRKLPYTSIGFAIASLDCRGQSGDSEDLGVRAGNTFHGHIIRGLANDPCKLAFRDIFLDTAQLARIVASFDEVDARRMGAFGGSQGGALTLACAALAPDLIKRAAPHFPFLCDYQRVWEMDLSKNAYEELRSFFRWFDPRHERTQEIFTKLGYIDCQHLASRIKAEVLMGCGLMDEICPPSTQFAAFNKITSPKEVKIYPDFGHETLPGFEDMVFEFLSSL